MMRFLRLGIPVVLGLALLADPLPAQMGGGGGCGGGGGGGGAMRRDPASRVSSRYDEASNTTSVSMGPVGRDSDAFRVRAAYECSGNGPCVPFAVQLVIVGYGLAPSPAERPALVFALDNGATVEAPDARFLAQRTTDADVTEMVIAVVPVDEYLKIARAEKVEVRYGGAKASLSREQRDALRDVAKRIEKAKG